ncbi:methyltransferase domain-containing protein [Micromonospora sp. NPDC049230]|uniref:class I SAM-dependent methyltransferase n=1 Tax=Micromonospora sp. NPDC049230 TaxID=3155502 RepID=UPI0033DFB440
MLSLAGDVAGLRILDAGCGGGHYAAELVGRGAEVVAVDGSATLVRHARALLGDRADVRQHDLDAPLKFAADTMVVGLISSPHLTSAPRLRHEHRQAGPGIEPAMPVFAQVPPFLRARRRRPCARPPGRGPGHTTAAPARCPGTRRAG